MKLLARKPFLLGLILSLPLWVVFDNFLVGFSVALLIAFLLSMCVALRVLKRQSPAGQGDDSRARPPDSP